MARHAPMGPSPRYRLEASETGTRSGPCPSPTPHRWMHRKGWAMGAGVGRGGLRPRTLSKASPVPTLVHGLVWGTQEARNLTTSWTPRVRVQSRQGLQGKTAPSLPPRCPLGDFRRPPGLGRCFLGVLLLGLFPQGGLWRVKPLLNPLWVQDPTAGDLP